MKQKQLTLRRAARKLADLTQEYLDSLPSVERKKRLKAIEALAARAALRQQKHLRDTPAKSGGTVRTSVSPLAARAQ